ncbi:glycosyltransferase [Aeromicrobium sp.]|uniref:glycosyltransferase n=1 Tax=Aeromicrobium sp. TaxID=1871063 RepID=UPI002FCA26D3
MTEPSGTRGRIVMLVDNGVRFDSRVQKEAVSAAERGWDVVLLGRKPAGDQRVEWNIGQATVRLIRVLNPMKVRRFEYRRGGLRSPLAYPPGPLAAYRVQGVKAWKADLVVRRAVLSGRRSAWASAGRFALGAQLFMAKVAGRWVSFRSARTDSLNRRRKAMDGPLDRFTTAMWQKVLGDRAWRRLDPGVWDWELAYGPVIDDLKPDLIHANDFRMLAVGARAAARAKASGRPVKLVWDAHEFLPGMRSWGAQGMHPRWRPAMQALEHEFAPYADAVVTVSDELGDLLVQEHGLQQQPGVVLNAPMAHDASSRSSTAVDVRTACGLTTDTPLIVYSGLAAHKRGLDTMVDALPMLDGVHVALVVSDPELPYVVKLSRRAEALGARDRLHLVPYVPIEDIVPYLSTADVGAIPLHHWPNHEISLLTKFFEYSHARLPIVVSDVQAMAAKVRETGQGEVFVAEDVDDYVRAVKDLLADNQRYRRAYDTPGLLEEWTWERQADELDRIYSRLVSGD